MIDRSHLLLALSLLLITTSSALAQQTTVAPAAGIDTGALAAELARVLAFVIVIESAMSAVFNWRLYRVLLGGHAMQTPIMVLVGFLVVSLFDYDIVARLLHITMPSSAQPASNWLSMTLSALVIAGGSNGVFTIFARLGLRSPLAGSDAAPELDQTQAWLAIHLVGTNLPGESLRDKIADAFGLNTARFPKSGGRTVKVGTDYEITLICRDHPGATAITHAVGVYRFAPRAIVDLYLPVPSAVAGKPALAQGSDQYPAVGRKADQTV